MNEPSESSATLAADLGVWKWNMEREFRLSPLLEMALGFPARSYFQTLLESRALAVADARSDARAAALNGSYRIPQAIASLLDAAIRGRSGNAALSVRSR